MDFMFAGIIISVIIGLVVIILGLVDNGVFYCTVNKTKRNLMWQN